MIGLGSAFSQALQGMQKGQQMNQQQQQQEQFDRLKTQFDQQQDDRAKNDMFKAVYSGKKFGNWDDLIGLGKKYQGRFDDAEVRISNEDDYLQFRPDGTRGVNSQVRSKFKAETGMTLPEDDTQAQEILKKAVMVTDGNGKSRFTTGETLAAGFGPGYKLYERQKDFEQHQLVAQMKGKQKEATDLEIYSNLEARVVKDGLKSLEPAEVATYNALGTKYKQHQFKAKKRILEGTYNDAITKFSKGQGIDDEVVTKAISDQTMAGLEYKGEDRITKSLGAYGQLARVNEEIQSTLFAPSKTGAVNAELVKATKRMAPEDFKKMNETDQKAYLRTISTQSKAMAATMKVLKEQSGSAVAEEEFIRVLNTALGGDITLLNANTLGQALDTFTRETGESLKKDIDAIPDRFAGTKLGSLKKFNSFREGRSYTKETKPEKYIEGSGTGSFSEVSTEQPVTEIEQGIKAVGDVASKLYDKFIGSSDNKYIQELKGLKDEKSIQQWIDKNYLSIPIKEREAVRQYLEAL